MISYIAMGGDGKPRNGAAFNTVNFKRNPHERSGVACTLKRHWSYLTEPSERKQPVVLSLNPPIRPRQRNQASHAISAHEAESENRRHRLQELVNRRRPLTPHAFCFSATKVQQASDGGASIF
jgi:hypothetical protein